MKLTTTNKQVVEEVPWGTYVFKLKTGEYLGDGEERLLCIFAFKGDSSRIQQLVDAVRKLGYGPNDGNIEYWSGQRPISDEEFEEQMNRQKLGLVPDPLDYGAIMDEMKSARHHDRG